MVCSRMGLLDDAIREHLELKRRRGADPGEVAREQHEALDPVPRERSADAEDGGSPAEQGGEVDAVHARGAGERTGSAGSEPALTADPSGPADAAVVGETAELDMRSVLEGDGGDAAASEPEQPLQPGGDGPLAEEDSLEWEVPSEAAHAQQAEALDEDVLEETPDFLRDTPEQERLWFEQRPPRDFDFDK
jgi:hypothetical protein